MLWSGCVGMLSFELSTRKWTENGHRSGCYLSIISRRRDITGLVLGWLLCEAPFLSAKHMGSHSIGASSDTGLAEIKFFLSPADGAQKVAWVLLGAASCQLDLLSISFVKKLIATFPISFFGTRIPYKTYKTCSDLLIINKFPTSGQ